jgi:ABC-2 type transport system ATP-binding protein
MIAIRELRKTFPARGQKSKGPVEAVRGINLDVGQGEIFGLLGPNGAGKTTTMRMLCTLLTPSAGSAIIAGHDLLTQQAQVRKKIGYVSQAGGMERECSGRENLLLQARLYGMSRSDAASRVSHLIRVLQADGFADRRTGTYSGGQRRVLDLASGIVHEPQLLFLDEPSTGLDPQNRAHVWEHVRRLRETGVTVFLSTHYLEEADALCDRVAIVDHGGIVALGSPEELKRGISGDVVSIGLAHAAAAQHARTAFDSNTAVKELAVEDATLHLKVEKGEEHLAMLIATLNQHGFSINSVRLMRTSLDDVFLKLTGRTLRHE